MLLTYIWMGIIIGVLLLAEFVLFLLANENERKGREEEDKYI